MRYSTSPGICAIDGIAIPKENAGGKGYKSPKPAITVINANTDGTVTFDYTTEALCKEHYFEAFTEVYPGEPLPVI